MGVTDGAGRGGTTATDAWDRSCFASGSELDVREALTALERVLEHPALDDGARTAVGRARAALRDCLDRG